MTNTDLASDPDIPVPIRAGDRITVADGRPLGYVRSLHRDLKNGRPGVRYRAPFGPEQMKWTYLTDILTVNGQPTDYAQRYPAPADPHHRLTLARLPVPGAFDPAEEEDNCGGFVGVDVRVSLRMYVLPEEVGDPMALYEALANRLEREFAALRYTVPAAL